jgi:hypothetical protein
MVDAVNPQPDLQREVQRLLGRCMLRVQQYERLMKAVLAEHELAGPVDSLQVQRVERSDKLADKTLGTLVKALFETYIVPDGFERDLLPEGKVPKDKIAMAFSFRLEMAPDKRSETKAAIQEVVDLRNDLVHHLIERFDLWTEDGCVEAVAHLHDSYDRIDRHFVELVEWARTMDAARSAAAGLAQSPTFLDLFVNGIAPDGTFEWPSAGIVRVLREAAARHAVGGWARLSDARSWISAEHVEQTPEKYGCRTWPQVLAESRMFDLQYRVAKDGGKVAWYRVRRG